MQKSHIVFAAAVLFAMACTESSAKSVEPNAQQLSANKSHDGPRQDIQWGPAPPVLPPGAQMALLQGDPSKAEEFTLRLRFPNNYRIPPHTHPTVENVTVLNGTFLAGMGTKFVGANLKAFGRDGFISVPAEHPHFAMARGLTVVQVHGIGPFQITYVDPADAPKTP